MRPFAKGATGTKSSLHSTGGSSGWPMHQSLLPLSRDEVENGRVWVNEALDRILGTGDSKCHDDGDTNSIGTFGFSGCKRTSGKILGGQDGIAVLLR